MEEKTPAAQKKKRTSVKRRERRRGEKKKGFVVQFSPISIVVNHTRLHAKCQNYSKVHSLFYLRKKDEQRVKKRNALLLERK